MITNLWQNVFVDANRALVVISIDGTVENLFPFRIAQRLVVAEFDLKILKRSSTLSQVPLDALEKLVSTHIKRHD